MNTIRAAMRFSFLLVASALLVSCATQQALTGKRFVVGGADYETKHHFFLWGIGQEQEINAQAICGNAENVAQVEVGQSGVDVVLTLVTLGIYEPHTARVYCNTPPVERTAP